MDFRHLDGFTGQSPDFMGNPQYGEAIQAIWRDLQIEDSIAQVVIQGHTNGSVVGKYKDAFVSISQAQLQLRADHTLGDYAPDAGSLEGFMPFGMGIVEAGANAGEANLLTGSHVGGAADNFHFAVVTGVYAAKSETVRIGMRVNLRYLADTAVFPTTEFGHLSDLHARHSQAVGKFMGRQVYVDVFA